MTQPSIKIIDYSTMQLAAEIDGYTSLQFERQWQGVGEFELHLPYINNNVKNNNLILLSGDYLDKSINPEYVEDNGRKSRVGIIRCVDIKTSDGKTDVIITGVHLNGLAAQRIVLPYDDNDINRLNNGYFAVPAVTQKGVSPGLLPAETVLKTFWDSQTTKERMFYKQSTYTSRHRGNSTCWRSRYEELHNVLQSIAQYNDIGWEIYLRPLLDGCSIAFEIIQGTDRSLTQKDNSAVILSRQYDAIKGSDYICDLRNYRNVGYAGGAGEDADRTVIAVQPAKTTDFAAGIERFETFIDCGTLSTAETDENISLKAEGQHQLNEYNKIESITGVASQYGSFIFGKDYFLGDLVTYIDNNLGISQDMRVSAVKEIYEPKSRSIEVTLGNVKNTIAKAIRLIRPIVK